MTLCACFVLPIQACAARFASGALDFLGVLAFLGCVGEMLGSTVVGGEKLCGGWGGLTARDRSAEGGKRMGGGRGVHVYVKKSGGVWSSFRHSGATRQSSG